MNSILEAMSAMLSISDEKASPVIPAPDPGLPVPTMLSYIQELFDTLKELSDTNQFLTISINRCIDHSKVTNDVSLLASNTTFNLVETVKFPVDCIRRMQTAVTILVNVSDELQEKSIISDKLWFTENIFCLLSNAVRYSEGGTAELYVSKVDKDSSSRTTLHNAIHRQLSITNEDTFLLIELIDSGKGLTDEQIPALFAPFKQAQRRAGGTGLGLFALASRMFALGGYYGVRRRADHQGSIFWFAIPYKEDDTLSHEEGEVTYSTNEEECSSAKSPNIPYRTPLSILLVEDALPMQKVLSRILQRQGHQVHLVDNGLKACHVLDVGSEHSTSATLLMTFDVVLMDLQMPVMDGFEAIRNIRDYESSHQLPHQFIIAMSANSDEATVNDALKTGADSFVPKPFYIDNFNKLLYEYNSQQGL
jgi:CheY-like chemotaxis protein